MLNAQELEVYKRRLEAERERLMREIEGDSQPHNQGNDVTRSGEEEADEAEEFSNQLAVAQTLRDEVNEIDQALERIRKGNYGMCAKCDMEIPKPILNIAPESILCEKCKLEL